MSLELISLEQKPAIRPAKSGPERGAYGLCTHRRLSRPPGVGSGHSRRRAGAEQEPGADASLNDRCETTRHLVIGAASEVCRLEALAGQEVFMGQEVFVGQEALTSSDFADVVPLGRGRVVLALGDVSGKGPAAALCVPQVLYALRLILGEHAQPARALSRLNRYLCGADLPAACQSVSLSLAVLDVGSGAAVCACAGSEPPLILRAGGSVEAVNAGIMGLGIDAEWSYREVDFLLGKGDALLLATDGITEARRANSDGDSLCCEGLAGLALEAFRAGVPPGRVARAVLGGAKAFAGGRFHDDASVLVAIRR